MLSSTYATKRKKTNKPKLRFEISGYYYIALFIIVILGFWPSYFAKFFNGTADFAFYFHFHAAMMLLWVFALILQPLLIKRKQLPLHRLIGKMTYFLFPLIVISVILIIHHSHNHNVDEQGLDITLFAQFRNFIIFIMAYFIAIKYRHNIDVHARAMIATGIAIIEPALARIFYNSLGDIKALEHFILFGNVFALILIYALLIFLMIKERHQNKGRWVFPLVFIVYFIITIPALLQIHVGLQSFSKWFVSLPLT